MKKYLTLLLTIFTYPLFSFGQLNIDFGFSKKELTDGAILYCIPELLMDSLGNTYVFGNNDSADFMFGVQTLKYDTTGNLIWKNTYENFLINQPSKLKLDFDNNVIISLQSAAQGSGITKIVLNKYTPNGDTLWHFNYPKVDSIGVVLFDYDLMIDKENNIYVTGGRFELGDIERLCCINKFDRPPVIFN
ncbi:MAG: hypothetical protein ACI8P3_002545 [Saprospiraceae bacterium]|jgi:hypothetical protein